MKHRLLSCLALLGAACGAATPHELGVNPPHAQPSACVATPASSASVPAPPALASSTPAPRKVELDGTLVLDLESELTGKHHQLLIGLPPSFEKEPTRRYPTLYLLDGQWDFTLVSTLAGGLRFDQVLPEMLLVGLSYGGSNPDYDALRSDDYLPTRAKDRQGRERGGGASKFLDLLENTVIPQMERTYRADPAHRILAGASNGGLFALYTLFEKPELFWGYIALSPNVGWADRELFQRERAFRAGHPELARRLWLSSGSAEWPDYLQRELAFFKQLNASQYRGLESKTYSVEGERHAGVKPEAFNRALRFMTEPLLPKAETAAAR
jgi:predicted alpha/beta superfamily hydrolase